MDKKLRGHLCSSNVCPGGHLYSKYWFSIESEVQKIIYVFDTKLPCAISSIDVRNGGKGFGPRKPGEGGLLWLNTLLSTIVVELLANTGLGNCLY